MKTCGRVLVLLACLGAAPEVRAACNVAATGVNFGPYDVFSAVPLDSTGTVSVSCDEPQAPTVVIAMGASGVSGTFAPRRMKHAGLPDLLDYNLYTTAGRNAVWGDGSGGTRTVRVPNVRPSRSPRVVTVYGRMPPLQAVRSGLYQDTVAVTITW